MAAHAMRTYLQQVIGVPAPAERREAIRDEGLETLDDFIEFDDTAITNLCASVRKPGGTIPNPQAAAAGQPAVIPNPGFSLSAICEKRLKLASYTAKCYHLIGRQIDQVSMNRMRLRFYDDHKKIVDAYEAPEKLQPVSKSFGIIRAMDIVPSHLRERLGVRDVALSYVIRELENPGAVPALDPNKATGEAYDSIMDELIAYTPLQGDGYASDNATVFQILQDMVSGTSYESSIKSFQRTRNGRGAYLALCQHNMGTAKWDKIIQEAETYVMKREWDGKNARFTLKSHINKHREAHNDMVRAADHIAYEVPNEHTRVGRLLKSLTSTNGTVLAAITNIHGDTNRRGDFENAADFLLLTTEMQKGSNNAGGGGGRQRISAIKQGGGSKPNVCKGKTGVELRYHKRHEYRKLNEEQKEELSQWRDEKRNKNKDGGSKDTDDMKQQVAALQQSMQTLAQTIASLSTQQTAVPPQQVSAIRNPLQNPLSQRGTSGGQQQ